MKLDEFTIGQVFKTKSLTLTKDDIMRFANGPSIYACR
jgi:hypothetical protein